MNLSTEWLHCQALPSLPMGQAPFCTGRQEEQREQVPRDRGQEIKQEPGQPCLHVSFRSLTLSNLLFPGRWREVGVGEGSRGCPSWRLSTRPDGWWRAWSLVIETVRLRSPVWEQDKGEEVGGVWVQQTRCRCHLSQVLHFVKGLSITRSATLKEQMWLLVSKL